MPGLCNKEKTGEGNCIIRCLLPAFKCSFICLYFPLGESAAGQFHFKCSLMFDWLHSTAPQFTAISFVAESTLFVEKSTSVVDFSTAVKKR